MSQFYTKDQIDQIATVIGTTVRELKTGNGNLLTPAKNYDSFVEALDIALKGSLGTISCIPTSLSFTPRVTLPSGKDRIILRAKIEINGELTTIGTDYNNNHSDLYQDIRINRENIDFYTNQEGANFNTPEKLAEYLFLDYMGLQSLSRGLFKYEPEHTLETNSPLSIRGFTYEELAEEYGTRIDKIVDKANIKVTLMLIDNLPPDGIDYVKQQWGEEQVIEGCGYYLDNFQNT